MPKLNPSGPKRTWRLRYRHAANRSFLVESEDGPIAEIRSNSHELANTDTHLICSAPLLYEALKELLLATEDALMNDGIGCECVRCEQAKQAAYRAIGFAEGKTNLKEGGPGSA